MRYYEVAPSKVFRAGGGVLTYGSEVPVAVGAVVLIGVGKISCAGVVIREVDKPDFATRELAVLYERPLPEHLVWAMEWMAEYYAVELPTVVQSALPRGVEKKRRNRKQGFEETSQTVTTVATRTWRPPVTTGRPQLRSQKNLAYGSAILLNKSQQRAVEEIAGSRSNTVLLHGITGSGKTNVYLELARRVLTDEKSVIMLVPEIALTSQLVANFRECFPAVVVLHSEMTEAERHRTWQEILEAEQPLVVVGPRSALFAPVQKLGLIMIDEAHEPAYCQDQAPKYSALRLAAVMAKTVLGTATPAVADYFLCESRDAVVDLQELAVKSDAKAEVRVVDLKDRSQFRKHRLFSDGLLASMERSLKAGQQTLIYHNRRGSAPMTICESCGWQALCPGCLLPLILHADVFVLQCHTCGRKLPVPTGCPECGAAGVIHKGFGTKLLEEEVRRIFPEARVARFDADTAPEKQMRNIYTEVRAGQYDILIGTQAIAKGFDFPALATLGVIQADAQLSLPDFSSEERCFQLLAQVIGRARRGHQDSEIFIQSYQPEHPAITAAVAGDYAGFYEEALAIRRRAGLPPFVFLLKLSVVYKTEAAALRNIQALRTEVLRLSDAVQASVAMPAFHEHTPRGFCWQLVVKSRRRSELLRVLAGLKPNPHLHAYLDPPSLI